MTEIALTGACECGDVRYRVSTLPSWVGHCHCGMCRRMCGAAFMTWMTVPVSAVTWESKQPVNYRSSAIAQRGHCPTCGAQMTWSGTTHPEEIDLSVGTLHDPGAVQASMHIYWDDHMPGLVFADGLPRYRQDRRNSPLVED